MPRPVVNPIAERIYAEIEPVTYGDGDGNNWALLRFIHAWTQPMMILEEVVRDTDDGPGWSAIMDPDRAPAFFLQWLSQLIGSRPVAGETEAQARLRIAGMSGLRRGSAQAMRAAAERTLTGTKYLIFNERYQGSAYRLAIRTLTSETPDPAQVEADLRAQKPAGIILDYAAVTGNSYDTILAAYNTYAAVLAETDYPTYAHMVTNLPTP